MHARTRNRQISSPDHGHRNITGASVGYDRLDAGLDQLYWAALSVCVLIIPLMMTGIREYGVAVFLICSLIMGASWASRQILFPTAAECSLPAFVIAVLAIGLVILQLQPLPQPILMKLAPFIPKFLTLWEPGNSTLTGHADWQQITMTPEATRSGLVLLIAYVIFFLTLLQHLQTQADVDRLMKLAGISAVVMALIGIGQTLFGNDKFLWLFEHPTRAANWPAKGTFHNQNHFAQFLTLGFGPLVWWWYSLQPAADSSSANEHRQSRSRKRQHRSRSRLKLAPTTPGRTDASRLIAAGAAIVALAVILSFSRGGIAAFLLAAVVATTAVVKQWKTVIRYLIPTFIFVGCALAAFGTDQLTHRWDELRNATSLKDVASGRWTLWNANAEAIAEFWPAGSGVGSHADVYPIWMAKQFDVRFSHAESGYVQVLLETGVPGFALLILGILTCLFWCIRGWRSGTGAKRVQVIVLSASLLASVVHSVADFVWYIPACMILTLAIAACACRCSQLRTSTTTAHTRVGYSRLPLLVACLLLLTVLPVGQLFADTIQRDLASVNSWKAYRLGIRASVDDAERRTIDTLNENLDTLIGHLEKCSDADPFHHHAHTALAPLYLQRFEYNLSHGENQLTLSDIRETVRESGFTTAQEMHDWLHRVCGDDISDIYRAKQSALRAIQNRPLRGESYIVLAETGFLDSYSDKDQQALIQQAINVRPNEPRVLYAAGLLAENTGETEAAWDMWRHAANLDLRIGRLIVRRNIDLLTVAELIERVSPTPETFCIVYQEYGKSKRPEDRSVVASLFVDTYATRFGEFLPGNSWQLSQYAGYFLESDRSDLAVACLKRATQLQPKNTGIRKQLATALAQTDDLRAAQQELSWLNLSMPDDQHIARLLLDVEARLQMPQNQDSPDESQDRRPVSNTIQPVSGRLSEPIQKSRRFN